MIINAHAILTVVEQQVTVQPFDPIPSAAPDRAELQRWCVEFRDRLRAMVHARLDPRLAARLDPSDVVQEALTEATQRFPEYQRNPTMSPYLWLRFLTLQRLAIFFRRHLATHKRAVDREAVLPDFDVSSIVMAQWLVDQHSSPSESAVKREQQLRLRDALETMSPQDREILSLRHFEQLSSDEAAQVLGITLAAASRRYYRALERLREIMAPILESDQ
jgi:RNA polymerase sigma-70 factor (ECF subfamily)